MIREHLTGRSRFLCNHPAAEHFIAVVPDGELAGGDAPLGRVEEEEEAVPAPEERRALEGLAVADADAAATEVARSHGKVFPDPVYLFR